MGVGAFALFVLGFVAIVTFAILMSIVSDPERVNEEEAKRVDNPTW